MQLHLLYQEISKVILRAFDVDLKFLKIENRQISWIHIYLPNSCVALDVAIPFVFIVLITLSVIGPLLFAKPR
jgi:hypothetical protein